MIIIIPAKPGTIDGIAYASVTPVHDSLGILTDLLYLDKSGTQVLDQDLFALPPPGTPVTTGPEIANPNGSFTIKFTFPGGYEIDSFTKDGLWVREDNYSTSTPGGPGTLTSYSLNNPPGMVHSGQIDGLYFSSTSEGFTASGHLASKVWSNNVNGDYQQVASEFFDSTGGYKFYLNGLPQVREQLTTDIQGQAYSSILAEFAANGTLESETFYRSGHAVLLDFVPGQAISVPAFLATDSQLATVTGDIAIADRAAVVGANLDALEADVGSIGSITLTDRGTPVLTVTGAEASADSAVLAKITGDYVLLTHLGGGAVTEQGHGDGLTISVVRGNAQVTGGGNRETFVVPANFGQATISDFAAHLSGPQHDTIVLHKSDFANFPALLGDAAAGGGGVVLTAGHGDHLTLPGLSLAGLQGAGADFQFV